MQLGFRGPDNTRQTAYFASLAQRFFGGFDAFGDMP
jgi:hypothetical protein